MKKSLKISVIILSLLLICSVTGVLIAQSASRPDLKEEAKRLPSNVDFWSDYPSDVLAQALVDRMTDTELLSQVMMFGWAGAEPLKRLKNIKIKRSVVLILQTIIVLEEHRGMREPRKNLCADLQRFIHV